MKLRLRLFIVLLIDLEVSRPYRLRRTNGVATSSKSLIETLIAIQTPLLNLSSHPRALIQIVIQSLTPSPTSDLSFSARACAINAATLASLDAGSIAIKNVAVAVALSFDSNGQMVLDPDAEEEELASSLHAFAWAGNDAVWIESEGEFTKEQVGRSGWDVNLTLTV